MWRGREQASKLPGVNSLLRSRPLRTPFPLRDRCGFDIGFGCRRLGATRPRGEAGFGAPRGAVVRNDRRDPERLVDELLVAAVRLLVVLTRRAAAGRRSRCAVVPTQGDSGAEGSVTHSFGTRRRGEVDPRTDRRARTDYE